MHDEVSDTENIRKNLAIERMIVEGCDILLDTSQTFVRQGTSSSAYSTPDSKSLKVFLTVRPLQPVRPRSERKHGTFVGSIHHDISYCHTLHAGGEPAVCQLG